MALQRRKSLSPEQRPDVMGVEGEGGRENETMYAGPEGESANDESSPDNLNGQVENTSVQAVENETPAPPSDSELLKVEKILVDGGIAKLYPELPNDVKSRFKAKGEEVARMIREMLAMNSINENKVRKAILDWIYIIPNVSQSFAEQEVKIDIEQLRKLRDELLSKEI